MLIRAAEPVEGLPLVEARRGYKKGPVLLTGPGKVAQALGLDTGWSHHAVYRRGALTVLDAPRVEQVLCGPRIGIDYAEEEDVRAPWRLALKDSAWVSHRKKLHPL